MELQEILPAQTICCTMRTAWEEPFEGGMKLRVHAQLQGHQKTIHIAHVCLQRRASELWVLSEYLVLMDTSFHSD